MELTRYWFTFDFSNDDKYPMGLRLGCSITAYDDADALAILHKVVFEGYDPPTIKVIDKDVDISTLDANHVRPNMGLVVRRGVWFPLGYEL